MQPALISFCYCELRRKISTVVKASSRVDKFSKSDIIVSPSILSANFAKLGEQVLYYTLSSLLIACKLVSLFQVILAYF
jgi:hypothetical protein